VIEQLYTQPPENRWVICLDEMGPESAKSYPGQQVVKRAGRATQEIDYGRRGKGYVFGAFRPASGAAWIPIEVEQVYAVVDNLSTHRATDVRLFSLAHPRWELVFQPKYAAYLNLIEPWWKVLRSLALKGRRFETWDEVCAAVQSATADWNAHRQPGIASLPNVASTCRMNHLVIH